MYLQVSDIHSIYYETLGKSGGIPYLFIHGGPGLGFSDTDKRFFDPSRHFVIFYDQRGCGRSTPAGELTDNTTAHLIDDINRLLVHLEIPSVHIFAGSWGATLALLYTASNQDKVDSLILRGFFSATRATMNIYLRGGIKDTHPEAWARVCSHVPDAKKDKAAEYYLEKVSSDEPDSLLFAYEWSRYGLALSRKEIDKETIEAIMKSYQDDRQKTIVQLHYALSNFFISEGHVYNQAMLIQDIPTTIVHGRHDHICPLPDAQQLQRSIVDSQLIIMDAGHSSQEMEGKLSSLLR